MIKLYKLVKYVETAKEQNQLSINIRQMLGYPILEKALLAPYKSVHGQVRMILITYVLIIVPFQMVLLPRGQEAKRRWNIGQLCTVAMSGTI